MYEVMKSTVPKIAAYQCTLLEHGFFVRGGIAIGEHYMDRDIVFGSALIEAHSLCFFLWRSMDIMDSVNDSFRRTDSLIPKTLLLCRECICGVKNKYNSE